MPYPHVMRLHGPWEYQPLSRWLCADDGTWRETGEGLPPAGRMKVPSDWGAALGPGYRGRVQYTRRFGCPTGLEARERVWLVIEGADARGDVALNGQPLGEVRGYAVPASFDVTERLQPRNELEIIAEVRPQHPGCLQPPACFDAACVRPGREHLPGGLIGEVRLEVRHQNFIDRLAVHTTDRDGDPALHVAATAAGPDVDGLNLHVTGMRRELAFAPIRSGQTVAVEMLAADLPRWTPGQSCEPEPIDVRLLRHGEAVWETTLPVAAPQLPGAPRLLGAAGVLTHLAHIPTEDELRQFDVAGTPVIQAVPPSWAEAVCGRLAHHPAIVAWAEASAGAAGSPEGDPELLAALSFDRPWVPASSSLNGVGHGPR